MALPVPHSHKWSLADQALVSGCNFLIGIVLARVLGLESFGGYVIATTYLLYSNSLQSSLVVSPMMTAVPILANPEAQRHLARKFFAYALVVIAASILLLIVATTLLGQLSPHLGVGTLLTALVAAMAGFQMQDWLRRVLYATGANRGVFLADLVAYVGQALGLVGLAIVEALTAERALWMLCATFAASALGTLAALRLTPDVRGGISLIRTHWRASRDFLLSWQFQWLGSQGIILLGTGMIGPQAAGAIRAAQNLLGPVNVIFQWMDNVLPVLAARRLRERGPWGLWHLLSVVGFVGTGVIALITAVLWMFDESIMALLYGDAYRPFGFLVVLQALFFLIGNTYRMFSYHARAIERTGRLATASAWWAGSAFAFSLFAIDAWKEQGIMAALLFGEVVAVLYLVWRYRRESTLARDKNAQHVIVRRHDGSVHLVLPVASGPLLQGGLNLYHPSRWTGRAYKRFLQLILPLQNQLKWGEPTSDLAGWECAIAAITSRLPGATVAHAAALVSGTGPREKIVARLVNAQGTVLAYARVARDHQGARTLEREKEMLTRLAATAVSHQVPVVLSHGWLACGDQPMYFLVQNSGGDQGSSKRLTSDHFAFLERLLSNQFISWSGVIASMRHTGSGASDLDEIIPSALVWLSRAPIHRLPLCYEHGDFVPWNIRLRPDGSLFVFDWEHGKPQGLPAMDAIHFSFQQSILVDRISTKAAIRKSIAALEAPSATHYLKRLGTSAEHGEWLMGLYLLRAILARSGALPSDLKMQQTYRHALIQLVRASRQVDAQADGTDRLAKGGWAP